MRKLHDRHRVYTIDPQPLPKVLAELLIGLTGSEGEVNGNPDNVESIAIERYFDEGDEEMKWSATIVTFGELEKDGFGVITK
jgi:hypothetical protein